MANKPLFTYLDHAEQAAGGELDERIQTDLVNDAGQYLFSMHAWPWAVRDKYKLSLVANQPYVELPKDFQQLYSLAANDRLTTAVFETDLAHIDRLRGGVTVAGDVNWYLALEYPGQNSTAQNPEGARLAVYPEPSSDHQDELVLRYRAGWLELTETDQVPNIPVDMEQLLIRLVRAFALGYIDEMRGKGTVDQRLETVERSTALHRLKQRHGASQRNYGHMRGGIVPRDAQHQHYRTNDITVHTTHSV